MRREARSYQHIRDHLDSVPVIDTHEHYAGISKPIDNVFELFGGYDMQDFNSAAFGDSEVPERLVSDPDLTFEQRYALFEPYYQRCRYTAYLQGTLRGVRACYGVEDFSEGSLRRLAEIFEQRSSEQYETLFDRHRIETAVVDLIAPEAFFALLAGKLEHSPRCRFALTLPSLINLRERSQVKRLERYLGRSVVRLDDYLEALEKLVELSVARGVVCIKDQSAYHRSIDFGFPDKAEAEREFNLVMRNVYEVRGTGETKRLGDYLFNHALTLAAAFELPVQLHTGHMARIGDEIEKTNAVQLLPVINLHDDVLFGLFHGNWPYLDEYLFIGKNCPNVHLDLCWVHAIDPRYSVELIERAMMTMPHTKLHAFGGDTFHYELSIGYLEQAKDNVAYALSELVDMHWWTVEDACHVATDLFYENPRRFFGLGA